MPRSTSSTEPSQARSWDNLRSRPGLYAVDPHRLFFLSLLMGGATFNLFYSFWSGMLVFLSLYGFSLWATNRDPDMLRIVIASSASRRRYDPGKHERFDVEVVRW